MKRVLVTGGAGFIGSHLCDFLIEKGYEVVCFDNLLTGSEENIKHLFENSGFEFIKGDVVSDGLDFGSLDYIFHLASPASPADFEKYPEEIALTNTLGTLNMLKLARKNGARILVASTSEIYGDPLEHPQRENYLGNVNSFGPRSCYDEGKRFAETLSYIYLHKHDLDIRIVRIFNTYGPRMRKNDGRVVSNFINQALEGNPFTVYGKGEGTRSFCFVSDMVEGIFKLMFKEGIKGEVVNVGNPEECAIVELSQKIASIVGNKPEYRYLSALEDDPQKRKPDISKAKRLLDWEPKVSLDEGLRLTIEYYKNLKE